MSPIDTTIPSLSKSDFIRSQPANMPAKEVVTKAKSVGITLREALVYKVRGKGRKAAEKRASAAAGPAEPAARLGTKAVAKQVAAEAPARVTAKAAFILARPTMAVAAIVAAAKESGLSVSRNYIYALRSRGSGAAARAPAATNGGHALGSVAAAAPSPRPAAPPKTNRNPGAPQRLGSDDASATEFVRLVLVIGMNRAEALMQEVRARLASLLGH